MGLTAAKKYIKDLHRKQEDPYLWPDFLTGLPDRAAIIKKLEEVYPELGKLSVAYVRISNVHPYLLKYGPDRHAEVIQWAAAILKTTCERCENCFVGTLGTHDFVVMCDAKNMMKHLKAAARMFRGQTEKYYTKKDLKSHSVMSFRRGGQKVNIGLMNLLCVVADRKLSVEKKNLLQHMGRVCDEMEAGGQEFAAVKDDRA